MKIGANCIGQGKCEFVVWAPQAKLVTLELLSPEQRSLPLERDDRGYWRTTASDVSEETWYRFNLDGKTARPDPASHHQPRGVHESSRVVDHASYVWNDKRWQGIPVSDMIMYELHVGTFTGEGTFEAIIPRLRELRRTGINAVELMPIAQFPGERNWGYDGVYPFAVQHSYGGPAGLKRLVDAAHGNGIAVILDVVYNHLGPEGNYLAEFGPYFTDKYRTPWGRAINFDGPYSDEVRNYFIENALHWFTEYHIDALRLDAVHAITDMSARPFLQELAARVASYSQQRKRGFFLIAESNLNDSKTLRPVQEHGHGLHAQWLDDFHHCVHTLLTGERDGYYCDFGTPEQLAKCLTEGFVYSGEYSAFRKRRHGNSSRRIPPRALVAFTSNHDQVGNRMRGERLVSLVSFEGAKLNAAVTLLSPFVPMIFMGEEYAEPAPFKYFVSHSDADLIEAVRRGRREEFAAFAWQGNLPDPQSEKEFTDSKLDWQLRGTGLHKTMQEFFTALVALRNTIYAGGAKDRLDRKASSIDESRVVLLTTGAASPAVTMIFNFNSGSSTFAPNLGQGVWTKSFDSSDEKWGGTGPTLAPRIRSGDRVTMPRLSAAVYFTEKRPQP
jgi:maltooligosyltrehalose trehalohydrolase